MWTSPRCGISLNARVLLSRFALIVLVLLMAGASAQAQSGPITLVRHASKDAGTSTSSTLAFPANNTAGNWIGVVVRAGALNEVVTVSDSNHNTYRKAVQFNQTTDGFTFTIFYAESIAGGANTVTVSQSISGTLRFAILEYSGVAAAGSLDVIGMAQGHSTAPSSAPAVGTTANGDLLLGAVMTGNPQNATAGTGYTIEESVPAIPNSKLIVEDQIQSVAGATLANATISSADDWAAGFAAFKVSNGSGGSPNISGLNPTSGAVGTTVVISGTNFGSPQGTSTVKFNGTLATPTAWSATSITAPVPSGATTGSVVVNVGGTNSNGVSFTVNTPPSVTINQAAGQVDPTSASPINFTAVFSAAVTGFTSAGVTLGGTAGATTVVVTGGPTTYNVAVSGMTQSGTITASVPAGVATANGLTNTASTSTDNTVTFNVVAPSVTINQAASQTDPTSASPINFTAVFSTTVTGFTATDVTLGGTAGAITVVVSGAGPTYNVAVSGMTQSGTVTASIPAGVVTANGVGNTASTSTDNTVTFNVVAPSVTINQAAGQADPTSSSPINFTAVFSTTVTGFTATDVTLGGTAGAITVVVSGAGPTYNVAVSGMTQSGTVTASIPAGVVTANGVGNTASTSTDNTVTFNLSVPPVITTVNPNTGPAGTPVTITGTNFGTSQGTSTVTFNGVSSMPTNWGATSITAPVPIGLAPGPVTVVVTVSSIPSNGMTFTVTGSGAAIALVQHTSKDAGTGASSALAFNTNNTAGNFIAVAVRAGALNEVVTVSDTNHNTYQRAIQLNQTTDGFTFAIYYAENVGGGANTVTVSQSISGTLRFAILEYSGVATAGSLDAVASTQGHSAAPTSGASVSTTASGDLLLGSVMTGNPGAFTAGSGYQIEESTPGEPGTKLMVEDQIQGAAGPASASATLGGGADDWATGMAAVKAAGGVVVPPPVISGISPTSGPVGATVIVSGSNFGSSQGNSALTFGGTAAAPTNWTSSSISAPVPNGLAVGTTSVVVKVAGVASSGVNFAVTATAPQITQEPTSQQVSVGQTATFTVIATGTAPLTYQWQVGGVNIQSATSASYTTPPTTLSDNGSMFAVTVTNSAGSAPSTSATLTVTAASTGPKVLTQHYDNMRSGQNIAETILTPANVNSGTFGRRFVQTVDGQIYAQPLYYSNLSIPGKGTHNVVFVATENDSVYAFDADNNSGANALPLWQVSLINTNHGAAPGATPMQWTELNCTDMQPQTGITSTPVIDSGTGTMYVEAKSKENGIFVHRLHAIDITTGVEKFGVPSLPIAGTAPIPGGGTVTFNALQQMNRPGLLLQNGIIYIAYASHCDDTPYFGWLFAYDAGTLAQKAAWNTTPTSAANGGLGGVWMSGAGLAADTAGNIYLSTGNGIFDTTNIPATQFGDSVVKLFYNGSGFQVLDYFTPYDEATLEDMDTDLGSGGVLLLPDQTGNHPHELIAVGKEGTIYLVDRDKMTTNNLHFCPSNCNNSDTQIVDENILAVNGIFGVPAYWNNNIYFEGAGDRLKAFTISSGSLSATTSGTSTNPISFPGATPTVSANGTSNGIVWVIDSSHYGSRGNGTGPAIMHAFDANNLSNELYNTTQVSSRDTPGIAVKFTVPTVINGNVYLGTSSELDVYGLLP